MKHNKIAVLQFLEGPSRWTLVLNGALLRGGFHSAEEARTWAANRRIEVAP